MLQKLADTTLDYGSTYSSSYDTTATDPATAAVVMVFWLIYFVAIAIILVSMWKLFTKAGRPGWAAIVPLYNTYILLQIVGRPAWWLLLYLVPGVNLIVSIIVMIDLAKAFGKSTAFAIFGLLLFGIVGLPMLAFGSATYTGAKPTDLGGTPPATPPTTPPVAPTPTPTA